MTSTERKEARYQRRKQKRTAKNISFEQVFTYGHLYQSYKKCRRNVSWKSSTQKYITQAPLIVRQTYDELKSGKYKSDGFYEFDIYERGKARHIKSVTMKERVVQRCLCDYALVPALSRTFIYDNSAALKGKGYHFAIRRLEYHLQKHYRKHGTDGYILLFDFSKFFDNIDHALCKTNVRKKIKDEKIIRLTEHFIDMFGTVGLGLGSQISQTLALASANRLDHCIKEEMGIKGYGRYMDDGYLIHESKDYLGLCLERIKTICHELKIKLNVRKTQIIKLSHGFTYLKAKFYITKTGRIIKKIYHNSVAKERRKLKKLAILLRNGKVTFNDIRSCFQSWYSYANNFDAYRTRMEMAKLYNSLFVSNWEACTFGV